MVQGTSLATIPDTEDEENEEVHKKTSNVSYISCGSETSAAGLPIRKSASMASTASTTSLSSATDQKRRKTEPNQLPPSLQICCVVGTSSVDLQEVNTLAEAKVILKVVAQEMKFQEQSKIHSYQRSKLVSKFFKDDQQRSVISLHKPRRASRFDSRGFPLEPLNVDVDIARHPDMKKGRRRSCFGTMTGASLPVATEITKPESIDRPFSSIGAVFRQLIRRKESFEMHGSPNDDVDDPFVQILTPLCGLGQAQGSRALCGQSSRSSPADSRFSFEPQAIGRKRAVRNSHFSASSDSEDETESRGPATPALLMSKRTSTIDTCFQPNSQLVHYIDVSDNGIESVSDFAKADTKLLEKLNHVAHLDLSQNKLSDIPVLLHKWMLKLTHLNIKGNKFNCLPGYLLAFPRLQHLQASQNKVLLFFYNSLVNS